VDHLPLAALEAGLDVIRLAPADDGRVELIVRRPAVDTREVLEEGVLDCGEGLVGDTWRARAVARSGDSAVDRGRQLTLMNARVTALVAGARERWPLAGDQLYVDFDLSVDNIPAGTRLSLGEAVVEISPDPHTGCHKFTARFGADAVRFVNSPAGKELNLRGVNATVITGGRIRVGDAIRKTS
jgi:hypothetical protein